MSKIMYTPKQTSRLREILSQEQVGDKHFPTLEEVIKNFLNENPIELDSHLKISRSGKLEVFPPQTK